MQPVFIVNGHDYTPYLEELAPIRNDLDASGSGRDAVIDGLMYRSRLAQKDKWSVKFLPLSETVMAVLAQDVNPQYIAVTLLDPKKNRLLTKTYYVSTVNYGAQRYRRSEGITEYVGCNFNMTER